MPTLAKDHFHMNNIDNFTPETITQPTGVAISQHSRKNAIKRKYQPRVHVKRYSPDLGNVICDLIIQGKTITSICKRKDMPCTTQFYRWTREYTELGNNYRSARELQARTMIDRAIEQPDKCLEEIRKLDITDKRANAFVQAHKLIVDTNKDIAGLLNRAEFGRDVAAVASPAQIGVQVVFGKCQSQQDTEITEIKVVK